VSNVIVYGATPARVGELLAGLPDSGIRVTWKLAARFEGEGVDASQSAVFAPDHDDIVDAYIDEGIDEFVPLAQDCEPEPLDSVYAKEAFAEASEESAE